MAPELVEPSSIAHSRQRDDVTPEDLSRLARSMVPGTGALDIQPIGAGLVNETYRVVRDGHTYSLRLPAGGFDLGLDRAWEAAVLEVAARAGLAPRMVVCDPVRGFLVARWVSGRSFAPEEARQSSNIAKIAGLLRRVHALAVPPPLRDMSPGRWVDLYAGALERHTPNSRALALRTAAASRLEQLAKLPGAPKVLCHSDLHPMNLIEGDEGLMVLDWEYAHISDPLWDLAGWSANNDFGAQAQGELLRNYAGGGPIGDWPRFRLLLWLYDYICLLWSELYLSLRLGADGRVSERARHLDARLSLRHTTRPGEIPTGDNGDF